MKPFDVMQIAAVTSVTLMNNVVTIAVATTDGLMAITAIDERLDCQQPLVIGIALQRITLTGSKGKESA